MIRSPACNQNINDTMPTKHKLVEMQQLHVFVVASESMSFHDAADKLGITQPAISHVIKSLETRYGDKLIVRRMSPIQLTVAGLALKKTALEILTKARSIESAVKESRSSGISQCKVGMITSISEVFGSLLITNLSESVERFTLRSGLTNSLKQSFLDREIDILISNDPMSEVEGVYSVRIFRDPIAIVFPQAMDFPNYSELKNSFVSTPMIKYGRTTDIGLYIELVLRRLNLSVSVGHETDDTHTLMSFIRANHGWSLAPVLCLAQCKHILEDVVVMELDSERHYRDIYLVAREQELGKLPVIVRNAMISIFEKHVFYEIKTYINWLEIESFSTTS